MPKVLARCNHCKLGIVVTIKDKQFAKIIKSEDGHELVVTNRPVLEMVDDFFGPTNKIWKHTDGFSYWIADHEINTIGNNAICVECGGQISLVDSDYVYDFSAKE